MTEVEQQSYIINSDLEREILYAVILVIIGSLIYFGSQLKKSSEKQVKTEEHVLPANIQKPPNKKKKGVGSSSKESRKPFTHQFLKKTLKGHGNKVLDIDVSSNGKLLASCSEDAPISGSNTLSRAKSAPNSRDKKGKCMTKAEDNDSDEVKKPLEKNNNTTIINMNSKRPPLFTKYCRKLEKGSTVLHALLQQYVLSSEQLILLGYPCKIDSNSSEVVIIKQPELSSQLHTFGTVYYKHGKRTNCSRCNQDFFISYGNSYLTLQKCTYHWGKLTKDMDNKSIYSCCQSNIGTSGCELSDYHVWSGLQPGINGPFYDYATFDKFCEERLEVFALDCEMCYTFNGLELSRVTVVNIDGNLVYDEYVKLDQVIDLNTRYSGITQEHLQNATKTLKDVQKDLMQIISSESILVGHGLNNDLRALKVYHEKVIDTCVLYPHYYGLPYRRSLRSLVSSILDRNIQMSSNGHDSVEDARASLELLLWKVTKDIGYLIR